MVIAGRVFAAVALAITLQSLQSDVSAEEKATLPYVGYAVSGLTLGMDVTEFRAAYPAAKITINEAVRFCYGRRVVLDQFNWATAVSSRGEVSIRVTFGPFKQQLRLTKVERTEAIDFHMSDFPDLRENLVARYGPYTHLLTRRKMEPGGRIVGFEWADRDREHLTIIVHDDQGTNSGQIFIETRLTRSQTGTPAAHLGEARSMAANEAFREQCPEAND